MGQSLGGGGKEGAGPFVASRYAHPDSAHARGDRAPEQVFQKGDYRSRRLPSSAFSLAAQRSPFSLQSSNGIEDHSRILPIVDAKANHRTIQKTSIGAQAHRVLSKLDSYGVKVAFKFLQGLGTSRPRSWGFFHGSWAESSRYSMAPGCTR